MEYEGSAEVRGTKAVVEGKKGKGRGNCFNTLGGCNSVEVKMLFIRRGN